MLLTALALFLVGATQTQPATGKPPAAPAPAAAMSVAVEAAPAGGAAAQQWAQELRTALEARKDQFRLVRKGEKPELLVRIDSLSAAAKGSHVLNAALVLGARTSPFSLSYSSDSRTQAEKLARYLPRMAEQMKSTSNASAPKNAPAPKK